MSRSFLDRESIDFLDEESSHFFDNMSTYFLDKAARAETQRQSREAHARSARLAQGRARGLPAPQASGPAEQRSSQRDPAHSPKALYGYECYDATLKGLRRDSPADTFRQTPLRGLRNGGGRCAYAPPSVGRFR